MKKIFIALTIALCVFSFVSCASTEAEAEKEVQEAVVLGKDGVPRPDWVTKDVSTDEIHYVRGYAKLSNYTNSVKKAEAVARAGMAEWINTSVKEIVVNYTNDAGEGDNRQAIDAFETLSIQKASAILRGTTQEGEWVAADDTVYVLMSIPVANVADQLKGIVEEVVDDVFVENEAAKNANEKMNAAIDKYWNFI